MHFYVYLLLSELIILKLFPSRSEQQHLDENGTLVLTHVIFRHGDRTAGDFRYPNDPYINNTYEPYGYGELTLKGKKRCYNLGKYLRQRYDTFLGPMYVSSAVDAITSDLNRNKVSIAAVLAGLFPPNKDQEIENGLNWQPVPYKVTSPKSEDKIIAVNYGCPNYSKMIINREKIISNQSAELNALYTYLTEKTGLKVDNIVIAVLVIGDTLKSQEEYGLILPDWTKKIWPEVMHTANSQFWNLQSDTVQLRRTTIGNLLKKIINDTEAKTHLATNKKIYLYSVQAFSIGALIRTFDNSWVPQAIPYGSFVLMELHNVNGTAGFKIFYQNYETATPKLLNIPGCGYFCSLEELKLMVKELIPTGDNWC